MAFTDAQNHLMSLLLARSALVNYRLRLCEVKPPPTLLLQRVDETRKMIKQQIVQATRELETAED